MKRPYECLYIIANDVTEEKRNELIAKFTKMAGEGAKVEKWGIKKFVTPIDYKKDGFYVLMNFDATPDVPGKIGALMNITDGMVRFMFVDKSEIIEGKKVKAAKSPKAAKEGEK